MNKKGRGFHLPFMSSITPEEVEESETRGEAERLYFLEKDRQIKQEYNNIKKETKLRIIGEYIQNHFQEEISYKELSQLLNISEASLKLQVGKLNFWYEYPIKITPVEKKKGYFHSCQKNPEQTQRYLTRKSRTIATMEKVYKNVEEKVGIKTRKKIKEKLKVITNET